MLHLNCFSPSWTIATCIFKLDFCPNWVPQKQHLNCFFPSWIILRNISFQITLLTKFSITYVTFLIFHFLFPRDFFSMYSFITCLDLKSSLQMSHLNCFFPSWTVATCLFKLPLWLKFSSQMSHFFSFLHGMFQNALMKCHKCHIWIFSFLHGFYQHVLSNICFDQTYHYKCHFLSFSSWFCSCDISLQVFIFKIHYCKPHIWIAPFIHEQLQCVQGAPYLSARYISDCTAWYNSCSHSKLLSTIATLSGSYQKKIQPNRSRIKGGCQSWI